MAELIDVANAMFTNKRNWVNISDEDKFSSKIKKKKQNNGKINKIDLKKIKSRNDLEDLED